MQNIVIISGPAGSGKDAIIDGLEESLPIERIVTTTTRARREGENDGHPYYFISREQFEKSIVNHDFVEYSINENNAYYGVKKEELERVAHSGRVGVWKIDWKGVIAAKRLFPHIPAIFIEAPIEILESRLRNRDKKASKKYFEERMSYTREWLKHRDIYDYTIKNEQGKLNEAVQKTREVIKQCATLI